MFVFSRNINFIDFRRSLNVTCSRCSDDFLTSLHVSWFLKWEVPHSSSLNIVARMIYISPDKNQ